MKSHFRPVITLMVIVPLVAVNLYGQENTNTNKFRQLYQEFATPNVYRTASGVPGHEYWQQRADYKIQVTLDDDNQRINGNETITYFNNSPDVLKYLWIQLDQNIRAKNSLSSQIATSSISDRMTASSMGRLHPEFDGGFKLDYVRDLEGYELDHTVNHTVMRIDLPEPLSPGEQFGFSISWWYNINDRAKVRGRSGMEYFPEEDNYLYVIAQFFPRMAVYNEVEGWQTNQFIGSGEFALTFGNYEVEITTPSDHVVGATGTLQNPGEVLSVTQQQRLEAAMDSETPVMIVTEAEARKNEKSKSRQQKTWKFYAENVRDFAFASSRKFIWDAMGVSFGDRSVLAMSLYPKEGNPLWEKYSTRVVAHTLNTYSKYTFDYPYPVAYSIHTNRIGMEYPMICFNGGRPEDDGTYSERTKWSMIGVIIHEVGHNFFPMIVNSDERQWMWMDEGLNTFLQGITEREWDHNHPSWRGNPSDIVDYMKGDKKYITPIMTNTELLFSGGSNAYAKPAVGLNILRETILGRELFDFAFREYAQRWMFKHPTPEDLFRTLEDASGTDLDWFIRGWFYTTDHVDLGIEDVLAYRIDTRDPEVEKPAEKALAETEPLHISIIRNREQMKSMVERDESLKDFYDTYDPYSITSPDRAEYKLYLKSLDEEELELLKSDYTYYEVAFTNRGGLVMPLMLKFDFSDGTSEKVKIPAYIWRRNHREVTKVFPFRKEVVQITLDPNLETADTDLGNNYWPPRIQRSKFEIYKYRQRTNIPNPMKKR